MAYQIPAAPPVFASLQMSLVHIFEVGRPPPICKLGLGAASPGALKIMLCCMHASEIESLVA